jgi:hypothetical protein
MFHLQRGVRQRKAVEREAMNPSATLHAAELGLG